MKKINVTMSSFCEFDKTPINICKLNGFDIDVNRFNRKLSKDEIIKYSKDSVGLIAGTEPFTSEILNNLSNLKVISRCGVGKDSIDLNEANKLGIKVLITPDGPTLAVAELTVGLIINLLRKINELDINVKKGKWKRSFGNMLYGSKVGIIGYGRIGQRVDNILKNFKTINNYYDIIDNNTDIDKILEESDIITLHVSGSKLILGSSELKRMKKGSFLVNTSRGGVIDEDCLYELLKNKHISGAALDVFKKEPYDGKLKELDNVILTPHIGSFTIESRINMVQFEEKIKEYQKYVKN